MKKLALIVLLFTSLFGYAQTYTPVTQYPFFMQAKTYRALTYPDVVSPDSVLVKSQNRWIGRYSIDNFVRVGQGINQNNIFGLSSVLDSIRTVLNGKQPIGSYIVAESDPSVPLYAKSLNSFSAIKNSTDALYQPIGNYLTSFTELDPTVPAFAKSLTGTTALRTITDPLYRPIGYVPTSAEIATSLGYTPYNGSTNPNGYITSSAIPGLVINTATVGLSRSTLNSTYPNTPVGFRVSCPDILLGGAIYIRITTGTNGRWQTISAPPTP